VAGRANQVLKAIELRWRHSHGTAGMPVGRMAEEGTATAVSIIATAVGKDDW